ncbi:hypothetical protein BRADI_1g51242v3 [Brachypodium distachyon]|uniref:Uncharacterized protein n=1 Tax=Brachypodium distachyon TaxID=15368 RepID=A0A2K2DQW4_BRADI|nr:hypothetical protein BRADI_1g51242v3 [Brachypodium distachyon]
MTASSPVPPLPSASSTVTNRRRRQPLLLSSATVLCEMRDAALPWRPLHIPFPWRPLRIPSPWYLAVCTSELLKSLYRYRVYAGAIVLSYEFAG